MIFVHGKLSRERHYREKWENYPHAKISKFTVFKSYMPDAPSFDLSVYESVCLWQKQLNLFHQFLTRRNRDLIFSMHTLQVKPFHV